MRFRLKKYALSADIIKMFRQVNICEEHWDYQRIFWRPDPNGPIREYYITVVVWGMTSATFNAVRSLRQCATDLQNEYPLAAEAVLNDFHVDDLLSGSDDADELVALHEQITLMLERGGFQLAKWSTNHPDLAGKLGQGLPEEVDIADDAEILGMVWNPSEDRLRLRLNYEPGTIPEIPTKADIVSLISKVYDPSGLYGPTVLLGKIIMQDFWRIPGLGWKDPAPMHLVHRWQQFDD